MTDEQSEDIAVPCAEHSSCIKGLIRFGVGEQIYSAGWWHFKWLPDQAAHGKWHLTDPASGEHDVDVRPDDIGNPPVSLIGAVPMVSFQPIVSAILEGRLFPPA